ncbi:MAG TPA: STAS domain-containing protein [bacterium]|nr:STAS domain-containing protein [bacterium]
MKNITVTTSTYPDYKDITLLSVKGFIDTTTARDFEKTFQTVLGEKKFNIIIDLKDVNYISSAGWGIFIGEIKRIRSHKGNLFLASMSPEVTEAYELLEFNTIIKSFPGVDQAVQKGFGRSPAKKAAVGAVSVPAATIQPETSTWKPTIVESQTEPNSGRNGLKLGWFGRLIRPWRWF